MIRKIKNKIDDLYLKLIKRAGGPGGIHENEDLYQLIKEFCYELYKIDWCNDRGFPIEEAEKADAAGEEYNREMYASLGEFEDCEFAEEEYMKYLLEKNYPYAWHIYEYVAHLDDE